MTTEVVLRIIEGMAVGAIPFVVLPNHGGRRWLLFMLLVIILAIEKAPL